MTNPLIKEAFSKLGLDPSLAGSIAATDSLGTAIDQFSTNQTNPTAARRMADVLISSLPPILRTNPLSTGTIFQPRQGVWESTHYANDIANDPPKLNFLFKVWFEGFPGGTFWRYVHRCDKPKVQLNHQDVNYYNFRTRVLTSVSFSPLTIDFLDDSTDAVNKMFREYMSSISGQGSGGWGIDDGNGIATSSKPYKYGASLGRRIIIQQIFNTPKTLGDNKFIFKNPRIESFDFDALDMSQSAANTLSISFSYDALECITGNGDPIATWGNTDIGAAGGSSNIANAGDDGSLRGPLSSGKSTVRPDTSLQPDISSISSRISNAISDLVSVPSKLIASAKSFIGSSESTPNKNIRETAATLAASDGFVNI